MIEGLCQSISLRRRATMTDAFICANVCSDFCEFNLRESIVTLRERFKQMSPAQAGRMPTNPHLI